MNSPIGPVARTRIAGPQRPCSQPEPGPAGARLAVISIRHGRVGGEAMV